jgi:hypothetical protein
MVHSCTRASWTAGGIEGMDQATRGERDEGKVKSEELTTDDDRTETNKYREESLIAPL